MTHYLRKCRYPPPQPRSIIINQIKKDQLRSTMINHDQSRSTKINPDYSRKTQNNERNQDVQRYIVIVPPKDKKKRLTNINKYQLRSSKTNQETLVSININ